MYVLSRSSFDVEPYVITSPTEILTMEVKKHFPCRIVIQSACMLYPLLQYRTAFNLTLVRRDNEILIDFAEP